MRAWPRLVCRFCVLVLVCLGAARAQSVALSPDEKVWLNLRHGVIRVGVSEFPPLVIRDNSGEYSGLAIDFLRLHEERLGTRFALVPYPSWHALVEAAKARQVDVVLNAVKTPEEERFLRFPRPYTTLYNKIIVRRGEERAGRLRLDQLAGKRVAVLESGAAHERLRREYPRVIAFPVREDRALMTAVAFHEADAAVVEVARATWAIEKDGLTNLVVGGDTPLDEPIAMAVRDDWPELLTMLDKVAATIGEDERAAINRRWIHLDEPDWLKDPLVLTVIAAVGALVLGAIVLVLAWNRTLRHTVEARTRALSEQLRLVVRTQAELRESERKATDFAEMTSDWFWEQDAEGHFTRFYGGGLAKVDIDPEAFLGKTRWEMPMHGLSGAEIEAHRALVEARKPFRDFVYQLSNRHGALRWVSISGRPSFDRAGNFAGYRGTGQDITERMHDQLARSETLERLRALLDGTFSFLGLLDRDGLMVDCNRTALRFIGAHKEAVLGLPFWETPWWSIAEAQAKVRDGVRQAAAGEFVRFEARMPDSTGAVHWVDVSLSPIFDDQGNVIYLVPEGRDVTDARRASEALTSMLTTTGSVYGEAFLRRLVEHLAATLLMRYVFVGRLLPGADRVRTVAMWADGQIVDNIEYELANTPCANVMEQACCVYPRAVADLFPGDAMLREMGLESYVGVSLFGADQTPLGIIVALDDHPLVDTVNARRLMELFSLRVATELQRLDGEAKIRELNESLERRVAERTEQLSRLNTELEAFSYSVSHDLRAPLRHIAGFVEMLEERVAGGLDAEASRYLRVIHDSAGRMGNLIDDLLAFSRVSRTTLRKSALDVGQLVGEVILDLQQELDGREIEWKLAPLPVLFADRNLFRQVLVNLLANAVKYTRGRQPARIEVGEAAAGPGERVLYVRDNGVGFNMKYVDKLFGVFQRLHAGDEFEGTGIGLANVKRIVERHGGRVWAEAEEGRGACFYFALPAASVNEQEGVTT